MTGVLTLGSVVGKADVVVDAYFAALEARLPAAVDGVAAGCHEHVIVDLLKVPADGRRFTDVVAALAKRARQVGLGTKLVAGASGKRALAGPAATRVLWRFDSVATARATEVDPSADAPCEGDSWISRLQDL